MCEKTALVGLLETFSHFTSQMPVLVTIADEEVQVLAPQISLVVDKKLVNTLCIQQSD